MKLPSTHSRWAWTLFLTMGVVVCLINFFALPWGDELFYAFGGMTQCVQVEPEATYPRIATLADIVRQQYVDYTNGVNGRVWLHAIVAFFSGFKLYWLFDILNSAMWFLLGWLLLREGHIQKGSLWNYLFVLSASWWFLWYADTCSMCSAFAVNYFCYIFGGRFKIDHFGVTVRLNPEFFKRNGHNDSVPFFIVASAKDSVVRKFFP